MTLASAGRAIRFATAIHEPKHAAVVEVRGPATFEAVDRLLTADLFLYDGQARQSLVLDADGSVVCDVTVVKVEGSHWLYADGLGAADLKRLVLEVAPVGAAVEVIDLLEERALLSLHGPFAWELASSFAGRSIASMPPLSLHRSPAGAVLRAGKTGEYGYEILVAKSELDAVRERLVTLGEPFHLATVPLEAIDCCVLETGGYVARLARFKGLSPFELQLQWRVSNRKEYRGRAAFEQRRRNAARRIAWFTAAEEIAPGEVMSAADGPQGESLACFPLTTGDGYGGVALLDRRVSHPGLRFIASGVELSTASPPLVEPTSNGVRPGVHSYREWRATQDAREAT